MKKPMKIIAILLLVAGIGLGGGGLYLYSFAPEHKDCATYAANARTKSIAAQAAAGTPRAEALRSEASDALAGAESVCEYSRHSRQNGMLMGIGGMLSIVISIGLLFASRKKNT